MTYWKWFFTCGIKKFFNGWLIAHAATSTALFALVPVELVATKLLFVILFMLVCLCILLANMKIPKFAFYHKNGIKEYFYTFQTSILVHIIAIISLVFYQTVPISFSLIIYFLISLSIRELWQMVYGFNELSSAIANEEKTEKNGLKHD